MGYNHMDQVWKESKAVGVQKLVLLAIAKFYREGKGSWPSHNKLGEMCGISARQVRTVLKRLQESGELVWVKGFSGKSNVYRIPFVDAKTSVSMTNTSVSSDKNFRLLNKRLNKEITDLDWMERAIDD